MTAVSQVPARGKYSQMSHGEIVHGRVSGLEVGTPELKELSIPPVVPTRNKKREADHSWPWKSKRGWGFLNGVAHSGDSRTLLGS